MKVVPHAVVKPAPAAPVELYDIWGAAGDAQPSSLARKERKRRACPPPPSITLIPKLPIPAAGTSYNPSVDDHQARDVLLL